MNLRQKGWPGIGSAVENVPDDQKVVGSFYVES